MKETTSEVSPKDYEEHPIVDTSKIEKPKKRMDLRGAFKTLIVVGLPTYGMIDADVAMNLTQMTYPVNTSPFLYFVKGKEVGVACNMIVEKALEIDAEYVYFREDDVITPPGTLERLIAFDVDIISGVCMSKQKPPYPIVFRSWGGGCYTEWYKNPGFPIQVVGTGMGAMLVKTEVFRKIPPPWFRSIHLPTVFGEDKWRVSRMTQDLYFCKKALDHGFDIWVDTGTLCGHKDVQTGTVYFFDPITKTPSWIEKDAKEPIHFAPAERWTGGPRGLTPKEKKAACQYFLPFAVEEIYGSENVKVEETPEELVITIKKGVDWVTVEVPELEDEDPSQGSQENGSQEEPSIESRKE